MIAIVEAAHAGLLKSANVMRNVLAGIVVAVIALPLSMAFAIASGAKPEAGIYTSIVAVIIVSLFGGSRVQITGPTSAFVGVLIGVVSKYGLSGLQIATIMAGGIMLLLGFFKCGQMIKFIPEQVITGFTAGIGVNMFASQIPSFFGLQCGYLPANLQDKISVLIDVFHTISWQTTCFGLATLVLMVMAERSRFRKFPTPLLALIFGMTIQAIFGFSQVETIGSVFGGLPNKLPSFTPTGTISFSLIQKLIGPAFAIAMLGAIESLLCAVIADGLIGTHHDSNQELMAHGIANIVSPLFGGIATTGSIARTAASIKIGANSPLAGITSAIILAAIICFLAPLAKFIPLTTLSAVLFLVAYRMINVKHFINLLIHAPKSDAIILMLTFGLTLFCGIVMAVNAGVMLSALMLMHRMAGSGHIDRVQKEKHTEYDFSTLPNGIAIYNVSGPMFFGIIDKFSHAFSSIEENDKIIILRLFDVPFIDATGLERLHLTMATFERFGKKILLSEANDAVMQKLQRSHMMDYTTICTAKKSIIEVIKIADNMLQH